MEKDCDVVSREVRWEGAGHKELSKFITAQPQIENELVYDRKGESQLTFSVGRSTNKRAPEERAGPTITILADKLESFTSCRPISPPTYEKRIVNRHEPYWDMCGI